jgi:hypothetical protein
MKSNLFKYLALALVLLTLITAGACTQPEEAPTVPEETTPAPSPQVRITAKEAYDIALSHATIEYGDVYLSEIRAGYATIIYGRLRNLAGGLSEEWSVSFIRQGGEDQWIGILVTVENGEVTYSAEGEPYPLYGETWADYVRSWTVDLNKWNIDSPEAVEIAEEAGGAEFRLLMLNLTPYGNCWHVVFGPATMEKGEHPGLAVQINAENGEVISTETRTFEIY